eukprot:CAMPEP_0201496508 /NCGR_PEP_ID=MMETSP0151_2-20130828/60140_1 /ASSEMBLY_ACC=CAM_ASM_000257 /TAXON_ID=200890 /ORGANISM="Paramoeba atlantica, Strain 621/1 / CCAP 1560/9" /LENGTH=88 /DNA_ID=CAMNT_0047886379 /DNA_START=48 /DNA_END=310 /DNA_ORIENTATION=-
MTFGGPCEGEYRLERWGLERDPDTLRERVGGKVLGVIRESDLVGQLVQQFGHQIPPQAMSFKKINDTELVIVFRTFFLFIRYGISPSP